MESNQKPVIPESAYVAPTAVVTGEVTFGEHAVVLFGAVVRGDVAAIKIGDETNIQDNTVIHCDTGLPTIIGRRVTIGHAAIVHSSTVGDSCLVGIGSMALSGSEMGEGSWLAAGAVLAEGKSIPPWTVAVGVPAKPIRELTEAEVDRQRKGVDTYLRLGEHYRANYR